MFVLKKKYFFIVENIKNINLDNIKNINKFNIIYRSNKIKDKTNGVLFKTQTVESINSAIDELEKSKFNKKQIIEENLKFSSKNFQKKLKQIIQKEYDTHKKIYCRSTSTHK